MDFQQTLIYQFAQISTAQRVSLDRDLRAIGLFGGQVFVLFELWRKGSLSQAEIAKNLGITAPTVNKMVRSLTESGFVTLGKSAADARVMKVSLTDRGHAVRAHVEAVWEQAEDRFSRNLTPAEKLMMLQLLEKLGATLAENEAEDL